MAVIKVKQEGTRINNENILGFPGTSCEAATSSICVFNLCKDYRWALTVAIVLEIG